MKITFACVENSSRSQITEALAIKMFTASGIEFSSAGTHPAAQVDEKILTMLKKSGINWKGYPKSFADIDKPDIVVTMGCDVRCPYIPGVRTISWEIPDPKGKSQEQYGEVKKIIEKKLGNLINKLTKN